MKRILAIFFTTFTFHLSAQTYQPNWESLKINKDSFYIFYTASDDGSKLFIDDMEVVNNDGNHGVEEKSGKPALKKGWQKIKLTYYDAGGGNDL